MRFPYSSPPKKKLCLCVCSGENIFLIISSEAYRAAPADSQLAIFKEELTALTRQSYIDVSKYYDSFSPEAIAKGVEQGVHVLAQSARSRIKHCVADQPYLPGHVKKAILKNL